MCFTLFHIYIASGDIPKNIGHGSGTRVLEAKDMTPGWDMTFKSGFWELSQLEKKVELLGNVGIKNSNALAEEDMFRFFDLFCIESAHLHVCRRAMERAVSEQVADSSMKLEVSLPSGRCETVKISQCETIADLTIAAQQSLRQAFLKLVAPDGRLLNPKISLRFCGLQDGNSLTAVAQQPKISATWNAFSLWCVGGSTFLTWGKPLFVSNSKAIGHCSEQACGTSNASAAISADWNRCRSIRCATSLFWTNARWLCDMGQSRPWWWHLQSSRPAEQCSADVCHGGCFCCHFGRWKRDDVGQSKPWWWQLWSPTSAQECSADLWHRVCFCCHVGRALWWHGEISREVVTAPEFKTSSGMFSRLLAPAAILGDGSVVTWGHPAHGGDSSRVQDFFRYS